MTASSPGSSEGWLVRTGSVRAVIGYAEVCDLLNDPRMHADFNIGDGTPGSPEPGPSLLTINGEEHRRVRAIVGNRFTPRAVSAIRPLARDAAHELIDKFVPAGRCEFMSEFALPYVAFGICRYLGFSANEVEKSSSLALDPGRLVELVEYSRETMARRHRSPTGDILSTVAQAVDDGKLPEILGVSLIAGLLSAGHSPTINQLGIMVGVLSEVPDVWRAVGQGLVEADPVVEEVLRFRSTNQGTIRRVVESFRYHGTDFVAGERVRMRLVAANHDPRRFADPNGFDMMANKASHLAFGFGPHFCLGASLVRAQLQEALGALTCRITCPRILPSDDQTVMSGLMDTSTSHETVGLVGPSKLDIVFDALAREDVTLTEKPAQHPGV